MPTLNPLPCGWAHVLSAEFEKPYMQQLKNFLRQEKENHRDVYPSYDHIFRAFQQVDYHSVRVVILGQDPYHGPQQANGLAFAVSLQAPPPPSLVNIFKEVQASTGALHTDRTLESWSRQGVFLLNSVLTVRAHEPLSHRNQGWEIWTDKVMEVLGQRKEPMVFLLWGSAAQKKAHFISQPCHLILKAPHPSPLSAYRGFLGCRHFSKTNEFLIQQGLAPISW